MTKDEKIESLKNTAREYFIPSKLSCSETTLKVLHDALGSPFGDDITKLGSAFGSGIRCGCVCGALAGCAMALGIAYGRKYGEEFSSNINEYSQRLYKEFAEKNKSTCCSVLIKGFDMHTSERKQHCTKIVESAIETTANILIDDNKI